MEKLAYTYALVKSLYDQGEDYIDSFWPFAIMVFPADGAVDSGFVQQALEENFGLKVPLHVLTSILTRAQRRGYIDPKDKQYKLNEKGLGYLGKFETHKEVERRTNALIEDMRQFLDEQQVPLTSDQIYEILLCFLRENSEPLIECVNPAATPTEPIIRKPGVYDKYLVQYIREADERKPENYKTLQDMVLGSIISVVLNASEPSEMTAIKTRKFKRCHVLLDTNFVFSLLGLHPPEFSEPAEEVFHLLKKHGFQIKVFSFTIDEICRVVSRYPTEADRYPSTVAVDTLYSSLKRKGWTKTDAKEFMINIERILSEKGIAIEWVRDVDLRNYAPANPQLRNRIGQYKPYQDSFTQNHDLAAVEKIRELRGKPIRRIEDSEALFLTSDARLSRFDFVEMGHKENGTICEAILDRLLTNLLWLKDPSAELSLKSIIAVHSRDLLINRRVWDRFYQILEQLRRNDEAKDEDISMLFYHSYVEDVLKEFDETELDEITPQFVLEKIEEASKLPEEELQRRVEEKEREFLQRLEEGMSKKGQEKDKEWLEKLGGIKGRLREVAEESAKKRTWAMRISVIILLAIPIIICVSTKNWDAFGRVAGIFTIVSFIIGLTIGSLEKLWEKFEKKWFNNIYGSKIKEAGLDKLE